MTKAKSQAPPIPLPRRWNDTVRVPAVLHVISLAQFAAAHTRGWAANSINARMRLKAENDRLQQEVELLREEIRIKDARMEQIPASPARIIRPSSAWPSWNSRPRAVGRWSKRPQRSLSPPPPSPRGSNGLTRTAPQPSCNCLSRRSTSSRNSSATSCGGSKRSARRWARSRLPKCSPEPACTSARPPWAACSRAEKTPRTRFRPQRRSRARYRHSLSRFRAGTTVTADIEAGGRKGPRGHGQATESRLARRSDDRAYSERAFGRLGCPSPCRNAGRSAGGSPSPWIIFRGA